MEAITADFQYHLGNLKEPGTNETLMQFNYDGTEEEYKAFLKVRKERYQPSYLLEFVKSHNRTKAIFEIYMHEGLIACLCEAAIHPELSSKEKNLFITLLLSYENLSEHEKLSLYATKHAHDQNKLLSERISVLEEALSAQQEQHAKEMRSLRDTMETLTKLLNKTPEVENTARHKRPGMYN